MSLLVRQAEEILETAMVGCQEVGIIIDRQGGMRVIDPAGWSLPAMRIEFAAAAVYRVQRRGGAVRVDGWDGARRCTLERITEGRNFREIGLMPALA